MCPIRELLAEELRHNGLADALDFETTADLPLSKKIVGQPRGTRSIEFGIQIQSPGFNIYVLGPAGTGRTTTIEHFLQEKAAAGQVPSDWVYVQNFQDPRRPRAIALPPGIGRQFRDDLAELIDRLHRETPAAFDAEEYSTALDQINQAMESNRQRILQAVQQLAAKREFSIVRTPDGLMMTPMANGEPMSMEAYQALASEAQTQLDTIRRELDRALEDALRDVAALETHAREQVKELDRRVASSVLDQHLNDLRARYADEEALLHIKLLREDVLDHVELLRPKNDAPEEDEVPQPPADPFRRYLVNLVVDHSETAGAPVIVDSNPTFHNLLGRIEYDVRFGMPTTDFTNIKAGSLHLANGGYLVLRASALLEAPHTWPALKRALTDHKIRIEEPAAESLATKTLDPEPIPLHVKIILLGSPSLYYSLYAMDEDFSKLFKVRADFDVEMDLTPENVNEFALFVAARCHEEDLPHFDRQAVAKTVEYGARLAASQDRLTTRFGEVADLVREAGYWATQAGRQVVTAADVGRAIEERTYRANLVEERFRRQISDGKLFVDITGQRVGQVNGLYVVQVADHSFGQPSRITAQTHMGRAGVISIEREVELAGPLHNRGVLTLAAYLGGTYAQTMPLSVTASLAFEQNYAGVDGDSASSAELYALLSSLSGCPIRQELAVTGSVNQWGQVQPIGGVTEKVEGFYRICALHGLTGRQGVVIPAANVRDLMLNDHVVEAVRAGAFHVYAVETIDEGLELLTGTPAGELAEDGLFPPGSIHRAVQDHLQTLAVGLQQFEKTETRD